MDDRENLLDNDEFIKLYQTIAASKTNSGWQGVMQEAKRVWLGRCQSVPHVKPAVAKTPREMALKSSLARKRNDELRIKIAQNVILPDLGLSPAILSRGGALPLYKAQEKILVGDTLHKREAMRWERTNGHSSLILDVVGNSPGLPYGSYSRLLLIHIASQVKRTASPRVFCGASFTEFMRLCGILDPNQSPSGTQISRCRDHVRRLLHCHYTLQSSSKTGKISQDKAVFLRLTKSYELNFLTARRVSPDQLTLWDGYIDLDEDFAKHLALSSTPIDLTIVRSIQRSAFCLDLYLWMTERIYRLNHSNQNDVFIPLEDLRLQMGSAAKRSDNFKTTLRNALNSLKTVWQGLNATLLRGRLKISKSRLTIQP